MATLIPDSRLVIVEDCGHMAPMERAEAVAAALLVWMRAPADELRSARLTSHKVTPA
jgi:hypothetical protein